MPQKSRIFHRAMIATAVGCLILLIAWTVPAQTPKAGGPDDALARGFQDPPDSARPRVWWHWMSGNITKEGIKADLEWMKRAGIAGMQNFDAGLETPQIVAKRLVYMTPEWKEAFKYAATLADELGLELAIAGSPGWSETRLEGGRRFSGKLPHPPSVTGPYQNQGGRHEGYHEGLKAAPPELAAATLEALAQDSDKSVAAAARGATSA